MEVTAGGAVVLALEADPVVTGVGRSRQGVVAEQRSLPLVRLHPHGDVLTRAGGRQWRAVGTLEADGDHRVALAGDRGGGQLPETAPGRGRAGCREAGVPASGPAVEQRAERRLPAGAEGGDPERSEQLLTRMAGEVEQRVGLGDGHLLGTGDELDDLVPRFHAALFANAEGEARPVVGDEQGGNARVVHAQADAVAGDTRLRHLEDGGPDPIAVTDADCVVPESLDGEVLTELAVDEVATPELAFPVAIGVDLVDEHRSLFAA